MSSGHLADSKRWTTALLATLVIALPVGWAIFASSYSSSLYATSVQEDGVLEWMSAWGFLAAAVVFCLGARRERRHRFPWFSLGLALFCLIVALEEISWGQRLVGYRPPSYFLEHNFQQELNVHNLVDTSLRKLALKAILIGYGVVLPLLGGLQPVRRLLARLGLWAPPIGLVPGFALAAVVYETYPWKYSGELVEWMLAIALLFSALSHPDLRRHHAAWERSRLAPASVLLAGLAPVVLLGSASGAYSARARNAHPGNLEAAQGEIEALRQDLTALVSARGDDSATDCGLHRRVYTWVTRSDVDELFNGRFARLTQQGLPEERADFFLDPWNSPYWIRHRCSSSGERIIVYSFGANRRRDSTSRERLGDDVAAVIDLERDDD